MPMYTREQVEDMVSVGDDTPDALSYTQPMAQSVWQTSIVSEMDNTNDVESMYNRAVRVLHQIREENEDE